LSAPCDSSASRLRWIVPALAEEIFPYCVLNLSALSATYCNIDRRSFEIEEEQPVIVGDFENDVENARLRVV
jgi:hypothetical protein